MHTHFEINLRRVAYLPWGFGNVGSNVGFVGQFYDHGACIYPLGNGVRSFSPRLMRFLSVDTLTPFDQGGLNGYAYCKGDPVNMHDPSGRAPTVLTVLNGRLRPPRTVHRPPRTVQRISDHRLGQLAGHTVARKHKLTEAASHRAEAARLREAAVHLLSQSTRAPTPRLKLEWRAQASQLKKDAKSAKMRAVEAQALSAFHNRKAIELAQALELLENLEPHPAHLQPLLAPGMPSELHLASNTIRTEV